MRVATVLAAFGTLALAAPAIDAQEISGAWQIVSETPRNTLLLDLDLQQDGAALTGTVVPRPGGRAGQPAPESEDERPALDIQDGSVDGSAFSFAFAFDAGGREIRMVVNGHFAGDSMEGTIQIRGQERPFEGQRGG